ncbi:MAG: cobalamin B12-binding domain-containing protein, partial [Planctomycetota bacterium]
MTEEILSQLRDAIIELDDQRSKDVARQGIEEGLSPLDMINKGIRFALDVLGERFSAGDLFLPELVLAAKAADAAVEILEPEMLKQGSSENILGKVLIATVKDDIHDIGKNIVALLMKAAGFNVVDIGVNRSTEEILTAAKKHDVAVIGLSALLTTTIPQMQAFIELLQESGLRDKFKVIVGGAP